MNSASNVKSMGTIMGIWAHPDDEAWWSSGVMMAAIANDQRVVCVTASSGHAGQTADRQKWPLSNLGGIRQTELAEALSIIGVHELHLLGYQDGRLGRVNLKAVAERLAAMVDDAKVDTILTFEPQGVTGHSDHRAVCKWSLEAAKRSARRPLVYGVCETSERYKAIGSQCDKDFDIYFQTQKPVTVAEDEADFCFRLNRAQTRQKLAALRAHHSQTEHFFAVASGKKYMKELAACECFVRLN